ncbi:MAG TPA: hypothetical protein VF546_20380 [Pyrinomonadaceae bacterium]|jgi:hypothetical protein
MTKPYKIAIFVTIGFLAGTTCVYLFYALLSFVRRWRTRQRPVRAQTASLWRDPGAVERLDFYHGPGGADGAPAPPFRFIAEHATGSNPCLSVRDARDRTWRVKWGDEVRSETFASRLAWAAGYHVEHCYFVAAGHIEGAKDLGRARSCVQEDWTFVDARFELDEAGVRKLFDEHGWAWDDNPFVGTRELNGLKIMLMLTSNWDNKDVRDVGRGSNTAIFEHKLADGRVEARYLIIDWGASMGRWGTPFDRSKWDAAGYEAQTPDFVAGVADGFVQWNYIGQRTDDARESITVADVRWLYDYLSRVTDEQLRAGLSASGATAEEIERFTRAIRLRLEQLERVCACAEQAATDDAGASPAPSARHAGA